MTRCVPARKWRGGCKTSTRRFCSAWPKSRPSAFLACAAEGWRLLLRCVLEIPASRVPPKKRCANIWRRWPARGQPRQLPGSRRLNWASTCACWRAGFTATRAKAKFSFAKRIGRTGEFCGDVHACWLRPKKKPTNRPNRGTIGERGNHDEPGCNARGHAGYAEKFKEIAAEGHFR